MSIQVTDGAVGKHKRCRFQPKGGGKPLLITDFHLQSTYQVLIYPSQPLYRDCTAI